MAVAHARTIPTTWLARSCSYFALTALLAAAPSALAQPAQALTAGFFFERPVQAQASDETPEPESERRRSWSYWTGQPFEPVFMHELLRSRFEVEQQSGPEAPVVGPIEASAVNMASDQAPEGAPPIPATPEATTPTGGTPAEPDQNTEQAAAIEATDPGPETTEPAAPLDPWADLDLGLFGRAVAAVPPGIPDSRRFEREADLDSARAQFQLSLAGSDGDLWHQYLDEQLRYGQERPEVWRGLADLVVELGLFEHAPALAMGLNADVGSLLRQSARHALTELYGRDFAGEADFTSFTEGLELNPATLRLLAELRSEHELGRARLLELFVHDHSAAIAHLGDPDPAVRLGAAEVLGDAVRAGAEDTNELLSVLLDRLLLERWPDVGQVLLETVSQSLEGRPSGDPLVERMRAGLSEAALGRSLDAELLVARALSRLPWPSADAAGSASLERGVDLLAALVTGVMADDIAAELSEDRSGRLARADPDVLLGVLQAIDSLCTSAGGDLATSVRLAASDLPEPLRKLLLGEEHDTALRIVAVGLLPKVASATDLAVLIELLCSPEIELATELRFAVMGAVGRFARRGDAGAEQLGPATDCLIQHASRPEVDLRRRALELLGEEALAAMLVGRDLGLFVDRLGVEDVPELMDELLALIEHHGDASMLAGILDLENFEDLVNRGSAGEAAMAKLIATLAGEDPALALGGARRLWRVEDSGRQVARRQRALAIVAALPQAAVVPLEPAEHLEIAKWSNDLREAGVDLAASLPGGVDFLQRLVDLHVPRSGSTSDFGPAEQALLTALFLTDIAAARGNGEAQALRGRILQNYALAEESAATHPEPEFAYLVRRSRARFRAASGDREALPDFLTLFDSEMAALLDTSDLRSAGELAAADAADAASAGAGPEALLAWRFSRALVTHKDWNQEPPAVRIDDLRMLSDRATLTGDQAIIDEAARLFEGLPKSAEGPGRGDGADGSGSSDGPRAGAIDAAAPRAIWRGLASNAEQLQRLVAMRDELQRASASLEEAASGNGVVSETRAPSEPAPAPPLPAPETSGRGRRGTDGSR